jgi:hypothetical protein
MTAKRFRFTLALLLVSATAAVSAQPRYLCDEPPTSRDARACEAAKQGPDELRRFIQRMRVVEILSFENYVNKATLLAWDARRASEGVTRQATGDASMPAQATASAR